MPQQKQKKYMVVKATQREISGVTVNGKEMQFGEKTRAFQVNDPGLAREIETQKGTKFTGDVVVVPYDVTSEPGHCRTFTVPEMPWKKKKVDNGES